MTLFTQKQTQKLLANCQEQIINNDAGHSDIDFKPVLKLFTPDAQCTWLLTELGNDDIAYGLCDLGMGNSRDRLRLHARTARISRTARASHRARRTLRRR
jgi:hypothetical protein